MTAHVRALHTSKFSLSGFGLDYERPIGAAKAVRLLEQAYGQGKAPHLPKIGWQVDVRRLPDPGDNRFENILVLMNVSGKYLLASHTTQRFVWEEVFGLEDL
jgi:hypothetical protein